VGVDAVIGQFESASVTQLVRMHLEAELGGPTRAIDQLEKAGRRERRTALRHEYEGRLRAFPLELAQRSQLRLPGGLSTNNLISILATVWKVTQLAFAPTRPKIFCLPRLSRSKLLVCCVGKSRTHSSRQSLGGMRPRCRVRRGENRRADRHPLCARAAKL
jgi:hypothetical protein